MVTDNLCYADLVEVGHRIQTRCLSSVEVTQAVLRRIAQLDGRLNSYATLTPDLALAQAEQADGCETGFVINIPNRRAVNS